MTLERDERSCWMELDDNLIYYQNDPSAYCNEPHFRIKNI